MAGAMRKMAVYLGLVEDDDHDDQFEDEYEDVRRDVRTRDRRPAHDERDDDRYQSRSVKPLPDTRAVRTFRSDATPDRRPTTAPLADRRPIAPLEFSRIETVHPHSYNDARRIGEDYRAGVPVITVGAPKVPQPPAGPVIEAVARVRTLEEKPAPASAA